MIVFKSLEEAIAFAISKEDAASRFYHDISMQPWKIMVRKLFKELSAEEVGHKERLELELMKLGRTVPLRQSETQPLVVNVETMDKIPTDLSYTEALLLALKKEQTSFRLYVELVQYAKDEQIRELLLTLAEDEVEHKLRLEQIYKILTSGGN